MIYIDIVKCDELLDNWKFLLHLCYLDMGLFNKLELIYIVIIKCDELLDNSKFS